METQPLHWLQLGSAAEFPLLTVLCLLPTVFALVAAAIPGEQPWAHKALALVGSLATLAVSLVLFARVDLSHAGLQAVDDFAWIPSMGIRWQMGVDGLNMPMVMLTTLLTPIVFIGAWSSIDKRWKEFAIAMLVLETGMLGSLFAVELVTFYLFWEVMLVPMYLIIGLWGGKNRIEATLKFFLYTMLGSMLMLVAIIYLAQKGHSFNLFELTKLDLTDKEQVWLFGAFAVAFLIKVPLFPFHTWLPDAHTEAPTPGSVVLAGVLLKLGTYGLLRFAIPLFPAAMGKYSGLIMALAVVGIAFGALMAYVQTDVKRLVAYSSVSHLGFVMLGICVFNQESLQGAMLQMVNHGLSTGALFLLVGFVYERRHTREISDFGGIAKRMPVFTAFFVFITMSSIALPLTNGFVGEFLIFAGSFKEGVQSLRVPGFDWRTKVLLFSGIATTGIVLGAVYMLSMVRRVFFGPVTKPENETLKDLTLRERLLMFAMAALILWIGLAPSTWLKMSDATVAQLVATNRPKIQNVRSPADAEREREQNGQQAAR